LRVAYLTAGSVGAGHLVRGIAIGRGLERAGFRGAYRMFGPRLPFAAARARQDYEAVDVQADRAALANPQLAQTTDLAQRLRRFDADLLIVDLFWAAVRWILPALRCEAWLLLRTCPPVWLVGGEGLPFAPGQFQRIVGIEPVDYAAISERIDPIVVCNPDECRPRQELRQRLAVPGASELAVALHAGERGELDQLRQLAGAQLAGDEARLVALDLFDDEALFPAAAWLSGADRIYAGAGYNAYWEARWLGYEPRTRFLPFRRTIDDQARRLAAFGGVLPRANGADTLARWIAG
jgi:hypothetical protein